MIVTEEEYLDILLMFFRYIVGNNMIEMAELILKYGYEPTARDDKLHTRTQFPGQGISGEIWAELTDYPDYKPMLDLLLKYDVAGKPTQRDLDRGYKYCLREIESTISYKKSYIYRVIDDGSIDGIIHKIYNRKHNKSYKDGNWYYLHEVARLKKEFRIPSPYILNSCDYFINGLNSYCSDENSTFENVEKYIEWANWYTKAEKIDKAIQRGNIYLEDKNMTLKEYMITQYDDYINKI